MKMEKVYCEVVKEKVFRIVYCPDLSWNCDTCPELKKQSKIIAQEQKITAAKNITAKLDSEALNFAKLFINRKLQHNLFQEAFTIVKRRQWEKEFPLNCIDPERKGNRNKVWKEIRSDIKVSSIIKDCKAALIAFSWLLIPYKCLQGTELFKYESSTLLLPLKYFEQKKKKKMNDVSEMRNENIKQGKMLSRNPFMVKKEIEHYKSLLGTCYFPKTHYQIEREIKWREMELTELKDKSKVVHSIKGVISLYDTFKRCLNNVKLESIHPMTVVMILNTFKNEIVNCREWQYTKNPSYLPFSALVLVIFMQLWKACDRKNHIARLTANLINEYCYHNSLLKSICPKIDEQYVTNQWDNAQYKDGDRVKALKPADILRD